MRRRESSTRIRDDTLTYQESSNNQKESKKEKKKILIVLYSPYYYCQRERERERVIADGQDLIFFGLLEDSLNLEKEKKIPKVYISTKLLEMAREGELWQTIRTFLDLRSHVK